MESSQTLEDQQNLGRATIVQYDLTSSEDELDPDQSYVYCSATRLSPLPPQSWDEEHAGHVDSPSSSHECQSSEDEDERAPSKRPRLIDLTSPESDLEMTAPTPRGGQLITVSSSSEDDQKPVAAVAVAPPCRKPYALRRQDLPPELRRFLNESRSFFTRPHSLERHGQHVAASTYMKAEERVLCEYFTFTVMPSMKLFCY